MNIRTKGIVLGIVGEALYATNSMFAVPLYSLGMSSNDVLFFCYLIATLLYGAWAAFYQKVSLKISMKEACFLFPLGSLFSISTLALFSSYHYIGVGVATTLLFVYPILVAIIMTVFFKEKMTLKTVSAIVLTSAGVWLLYYGKADEKLNVTGVLLSFISALAYALYLVAIKKAAVLQKMNERKLTFYVIAFSFLIFVVQSVLSGKGIAPITTPVALGYVAGLAIFPTIVSLETITVVVRLIGPTTTAILGAVEPLTALLIGVFLFDEQVTVKIACGILLILTAVTSVVLSDGKTVAKMKND